MVSLNLRMCRAFLVITVMLTVHGIFCMDTAAHRQQISNLRDMARKTTELAQRVNIQVNEDIPRARSLEGDAKKAVVAEARAKKAVLPSLIEKIQKTEAKIAKLQAELDAAEGRAEETAAPVEPAALAEISRVAEEQRMQLAVLGCKILQVGSTLPTSRERDAILQETTTTLSEKLGFDPTGCAGLLATYGD